MHIHPGNLDVTPSTGQLWLGALLFAIAYWLLLVLGFLHWHLANGLLFLAFWLAPWRAWPAIAVAVVVVRSLNGVAVAWSSDIDAPFLGSWANPLAYVLGNWLEPLLVAPGAWLLRRKGAAFDRPEGIIRFLLAICVAAALLASKDFAYVVNEGLVSDLRLNHVVDTVPIQGPGAATLLVYFVLKNFLGHFVGMLLLVPIGAWIVDRGYRAGSAVILRAALLLLPIAVILLVLALQAREAPSLLEMLRIGMLIIVVVFAMRHGWRGAAFAFLAVSVLIAIEDHLGLAQQSPVLLQLFVAIAGAMALLLGATADDHRRQALELTASERGLAGLADELRAAAARNLQVEEQERKRLAAELHDEFGQNLAALQTHLKLAQPGFTSVGRPETIENLLELARAMQANIRGVLDALAPVGLAELGLFGAIDRGGIRRLAEDAGLVFETRLEGDSRLLAAIGEAQRTAAFRIAQEAVTNSVRHAHAVRLLLRLRISRRNGALWLFLDIRDDGAGRLETFRSRNGLVGMKDRVLALGGRMHLRQLEPGLRLHLLIRQALAG